MEAVTSAMQQLRQVRLKEQLARPIRWEPQNTLHKPDPEMAKAFEIAANEMNPATRMNTRDWLLVATWWLLKERTTLANCNRHPRAVKLTLTISGYLRAVAARRDVR